MLDMLNTIFINPLNSESINSSNASYGIVPLHRHVIKQVLENHSTQLVEQINIQSLQ